MRRPRPVRCTKLKMAITLRRRTQRQIAAVTQIPETRLSDFICGRATPTEAERRRLAQALRMSVARLFEDELLATG